MLQESQPSVLLWIVAETGRETRWICGWLSNLKKIIFPLALPQHCWNVLFTHVKRRLWGHSFSQSVFYSAGAELKNWITFKSVEWLFGPHTHTHTFSFFSSSKIQTGKQHHFSLKPGCFGKHLNWPLKSYFQDLGELSKKRHGPPTFKQHRLWRSPRQPQPTAGHVGGPSTSGHLLKINK